MFRQVRILSINVAHAAILRGATSGLLLAACSDGWSFNAINHPEAFGTDGGASVSVAFALTLGEPANAVPKPAGLAPVLMAALVAFVASRTTPDRRK